MSDAWSEFLELCEAHGGPSFTQAIAQAIGLEAIATLRYQARRGNTAAAKYLCDRWLGEPVLPFEDRVQQMNREDARAALRVRHLARLQAKGYDDETAAQIAADLVDDERDADG